jgi:hypothetical protein
MEKQVVVGGPNEWDDEVPAHDVIQVRNAHGASPQLHHTRTDILVQVHPLAPAARTACKRTLAAAVPAPAGAHVGTAFARWNAVDWGHD